MQKIRRQTALGEALKLAETGIPCFPCLPSKRPACQHGFKDATSDSVALGHLWQRSPGLLIGVPTGAASGFFVVDVDSARHPEAAAWLQDRTPFLPDTRRHKTKSRGWHFLFQHRDGLRNTASKLARGIDTRSDGGYIIWWPATLTSDEHRFMPPAAVPDWLVEALDPPPPVYPYLPSKAAAAPSRLEGIIRTVANAREGERNALTFWGACRIFDMLAEGELGSSDGADALGTC
jgi:Bifunctional DNA primase/polymerase, N-terminal